jgi:2-dehydro-3-deoxyphosphooctonate aldolase (KDO 8-P synthase)
MTSFTSRFPALLEGLPHLKAFREAPFILVAGLNVLESLSGAQKVASVIANIAESHSIPVLFKASFDKANRTSDKSYRGPGLDEGLRILEEVRSSSGLSVLTDVHETWQVPIVAEVAQALQIPAMLCRQTDLIRAAAATGKIVNIKKGQFASPRVAISAALKAKAAAPASAPSRVMICERGSSFGYDRLVVDFGSLHQLRSAGVPVLLDATHAAQLPPSGEHARSRGSIQSVLNIARAGVAAGVDGVFLETHVDPSRAPVDGQVQLPLHRLEPVVCELIRIANASGARLDSELDKADITAQR